jgi:hypothetical protein
MGVSCPCAIILSSVDQQERAGDNHPPQPATKHMKSIREAVVNGRLLSGTTKLVGWVVGWVLVGILFEFVRARIFPLLG